MRFGALFCKTVGAVELEVFANLGHYKYFFIRATLCQRKY